MDEMTNRNIGTGIRSLQAYQPGRPISEIKREYGIEKIVKLASNENPFGPSPRILETLTANSEDLLRYPDGNGYRLKQVIASFHKVSPQQITLGNGSNDVLDLIARTFLREGKSALFSQHAFVVYAISSQSMGAHLQVVPATNFGYDLERCAQSIDETTSVVFIANPNNPTGTFVSSDKILRFLRQVPDDIVVVLDEAYIEYLDANDYTDSTVWLEEFPNLIITRTFSKAYALAGLRVGYGLSSPEITDVLNRVRQPFNVNTLALNAAEMALKDQEWIQKTTHEFHQIKKEFEERLATLNIEWIPSKANFLCIHFPNQAKEINQCLLEKGVIVRDISGYGLSHHLRVSIGTPEENTFFFNALEGLL